MTPDILCERDGAIATVTLFNPDKLNALNARMWSRLASMNPPLVVRPSKDMRFASSPVDATTKGGANACS